MGSLLIFHHHFQYCSAGWQVAIALITVGFAIVIALYGPVVFGSVNLTRGMEVSTKFLEFILPIKYDGKPAEEKVNTAFQQTCIR